MNLMVFMSEIQRFNRHMVTSPMRPHYLRIQHPLDQPVPWINKRCLMNLFLMGTLLVGQTINIMS